MAEFIRKHQKLLILLFLITVFIILPLVFLRLPSGHDYKYHMGRIYQISQNITHGKWFAPLYYGQINGYGYASPLFYGDVLLHLPAVLVVLGITVEQALRSYIVLCLSSTALVSYFCAKKITNSSTSALISSVLYTFSSYLCVDYITRVALGEVQAFIFIPVAFLGLYSIVCDDKKQWFWLPIGLFGVVISHTLSGAMLAFFFLIFALFFTKKIFSDKQCLKLLGVSVVLFFALSAFYIFPMLEQISGEPLRLTDGTTDTIWGTLAQRSMSINQIISDFNLQSANDPWIPNGIGLAIPIALITVVYFIFKDKKTAPALSVCAFLTFVAIIGASNLMPWDFLQPILGKIQFPWRLLAFATFFGSLTAGFAIKYVTKQTVYILGTCLICLSLFSYTITALPKINTMIKYEKNNVVLKEDFHDGLGGVEYLPSGTNWNTMIKDGAVISTNDKSISDLTVVRDFDVTVASFTGKASENAYLKLPLVMYKGYKAYDQNGTPVALTCNKGYVIAHIGGLENGIITVKYTATPIQTASRIITLIALLIVLLFVTLRKDPILCRTHSRLTKDTE